MTVLAIGALLTGWMAVTSPAGAAHADALDHGGGKRGGHACRDGAMRVGGQGYWTCAQGKWSYTKCGLAWSKRVGKDKVICSRH